jgi:hypothetical protein
MEHKKVSKVILRLGKKVKNGMKMGKILIQLGCKPKSKINEIGVCCFLNSFSFVLKL